MMNYKLRILKITLPILTLTGCVNVQNTPTLSKVDYLWVYEQSHRQLSSETFINKCEKLLNEVQDDGLSENQLSDNSSVGGIITNLDVDYDFYWVTDTDKVNVGASCKVTGVIQENAFRFVEFEVEGESSNYALKTK